MDWLCGANYRLGDGPRRKQKEKGESTFFIPEVMIEHTWNILNGRSHWALGFEVLSCVCLTISVGFSWGKWQCHCDHFV